MKKYNIKHPIEDMLLNIAQQYSELTPLLDLDRAPYRGCHRIENHVNDRLNPRINIDLAGECRR
jgi:hypothetical protein